jgi:SAM-dependent methyltransferase
MTIIKHEYEKSAGLSAEIEVHKTMQDMLENYCGMSIDHFIGEYIGSFHGIEFVNCCRSLEGKLKILDIGAGVGRTSIYLALQGHDVTVVEPSPDFCVILELLAGKANLNITIHECSIESIDFRNEFDACIFNASFHHCEDPVVAADKCYRALKNNGRICLINEQVLRFYKSKSVYYNNLKNNPGKVQHYGGNEHVYRNPEYRNFLKNAGFNPVGQTVPSYYFHPKAMLSFSLNYKGPDGYVYSYRNILLRALWYYILNAALKNRVIAMIARELSFTGTTFVGTKTVRS